MQRAKRIIPDAERDRVQRITKLFYELANYRNIFAGQWEEAAALIDPDSRNTFFYGSYKFPGQKNSQYQVDMTGALRDATQPAGRLVWVIASRASASSL